MAKPAINDADFIRLFEEIGPNKLAQRLNLGSPRSVYERRARLETKLGRQLTTPPHHNQTRHGVAHPGRIPLEINDGVVLVGSDWHCWPGTPSTAHRAFVKFCSDLQPRAVIANGDVMDGATISRHPPINWEDRPSVVNEIIACRERLTEIQNAAPSKAKLVWTLGNHDARLETRLATLAPEFAKLHGVHLKDHFDPRWQACMAAWINETVVVKHRHKNGIHATHNSTMWAGLTMITGHLHSLKVTPFTDYNGTRWGVDTGCIAEPNGPQFDYGEDNPKNHRSGFIVLTFYKGRLLWPEVVNVIGPGAVEFRGQVMRV